MSQVERVMSGRPTREQARRAGAGPCPAKSRSPTSKCLPLESAEFAVIANIIFGLVDIGGQHQQNRIGRVAIFRGPHHRRQMNADAGRIEHDFLALAAIVGDDVAFAAGAYQELMALAMRVFPTHLTGGHVEDHEVAFDFEGKILTGGERPAKIGNQRQTVDRHAFNPRWIRPELCGNRGGTGRGGLRGFRSTVTSPGVTRSDIAAPT